MGLRAGEKVRFARASQSPLSLEGKVKAQAPSAGDCVNGLAQLLSTKMEERSTNRWQHRLKREHPTCTERESLNEECGWKGGDSGDSAQREKTCPTKKQKNPLDSDRPSHGRPF